MPMCRLRRKGLSLVELLLASTAMAIIAGALGALAATIHATNDHCQAQGLALAHARTAWLRIRSNLEGAQASESFPACVVLSQTVAGKTFPETLVIWKPPTSAANPTGLPQVGELVVYTPNPQNPRELWEITHPGNSAAAPAASDTASWQTLLSALCTGVGPKRVVVTNRLHTASTNSNGASTNLRAAVRFRLALTPSETEWAAYRAGTATFSSLPWPLDLYGSKAGLRNVACFAEFQMATAAANDTAETAFPYFGAASLRYALQP